MLVGTRIARLLHSQDHVLANGMMTETLIARLMAAALVLYGLVATALLAVNMPPFQNPDEPAHFLRAAQVAHGRLVGMRFSEIGTDGSPHMVAGGPSDPAVAKAFKPFRGVPFHPETRVKWADWAPNIHWSDARVTQQFTNTAIYPPFFYIPSAIGVLAGRAADMSVVQTLMLSRLFVGVASIVIGALAINLAGAAAPWMFAVLTLPMSLALMASASEDGLIIACSALAGAMLVRVLRRPSAWDGKLLAGLAATLALVVMARPPYGVLAMLPLSLTEARLRWRVLAALTVVTPMLIWSAIVASATWVHYGAIIGADPVAQLGRLRADPLLAVHVAWATLTQNSTEYFAEFVGVLGWQDVRLPHTYYMTAWVVLGIAALSTMLGVRAERPSRRSLFVIATAFLLTTAAVFATQYLNWTLPGYDTVMGVYGRYFIPLALAGTALLPTLGDARTARLNKALVALIVMFPVVSVAVVMRTIVLRYYLS